MTEIEADFLPEVLRAKCEAVTQQVLNQYDWRLIQANDSAFINQVGNALVKNFPQAAIDPDAIPDQKLARLVVHFYCQRLHEAYSQDGTEKQEMAIRETYRFVRHKILPMTDNHSAVEECAQYAATHIWHKLQLVRETGAFLAYVCQIARRCILDGLRNVQEPLAEEMAVANVTDQVDTDDLSRELLEVIRKCLSNERDIRFVTEFFLNEKSYLEIADQWRCSTRYLHLVSFRSRAKLKDCPDFINWAAGWAD